MRNRVLVIAALIAASLSVLPATARARADGVGLGVALGADLYRAEDLKSGEAEFQTPTFSWGFFVDIPLLETFYITPAATIYQLELRDQTFAITDVDLNFKFIVPLGRMRLGAGITAGLTTGLGDYLGHYGGLAYGSFNVVSNLEAFVMVQYKRLHYGLDTVDNLHGYLGGMFRF